MHLLDSPRPALSILVLCLCLKSTQTYWKPTQDTYYHPGIAPIFSWCWYSATTLTEPSNQIQDTFYGAWIHVLVSVSQNLRCKCQMEIPLCWNEIVQKRHNKLTSLIYRSKTNLKADCNRVPCVLRCTQPCDDSIVRTGALHASAVVHWTK